MGPHLGKALIYVHQDSWEVRVCSLVTDVTVALFAGPARFPAENFIDPEAADRGSDSGVVDHSLATLKLDGVPAGAICGSANNQDAQYVARHASQAPASSLRTSQCRRTTRLDEALIEALVAVLCSEEESARCHRIYVGWRPD
ncbi:hypothetical protein LSTR_LSTR009994 [Laodelphax striatellus]|uniref:Uncharacterized protein n=1 Tax=Laodelphax striatellus TaxID=195883 RepID=A0A482WWK2_LAOST|nr:hypothetical protein LSTR_LSTR009994 [Laodelphax striatellus]